MTSRLPHHSQKTLQEIYRFQTDSLSVPERIDLLAGKSYGPPKKTQAEEIYGRILGAGTLSQAIKYLERKRVSPDERCLNALLQKQSSWENTKRLFQTFPHLCLGSDNLALYMDAARIKEANLTRDEREKLRQLFEGAVAREPKSALFASYILLSGQHRDFEKAKGIFSRFCALSPQPSDNHLVWLAYIKAAAYSNKFAHGKMALREANKQFNGSNLKCIYEEFIRIAFNKNRYEDLNSAYLTAQKKGIVSEFMTEYHTLSIAPDEALIEKREDSPPLIVPSDIPGLDLTHVSNPSALIQLGDIGNNGYPLGNQIICITTPENRDSLIESIVQSFPQTVCQKDPIKPNIILLNPFSI